MSCAVRKKKGRRRKKERSFNYAIRGSSGTKAQERKEGPGTVSVF